IYVPTNHAALVASRHGRRVIVGPASELLGYDEQLTALNLSKGPHKTGRETVATCFLRIRDSRVRDRFELESSDLTRFTVELGIAGHFAGEPERWFAVEDPVKHVTAQIRTRVREAARKVPAIELFGKIPELVHEVVTVEQGTPSFADCGVVIDSIEVHNVSLADGKLAAAFSEAHKSEVARVLEDRQAERRLSSVKLRDAVDAEEHAIARDANRRMAETGRAELDDQHLVELRKLELAANRERNEVELRNQREQLAVAARLELAKAETEARAARKLHDAEIEAQA